MFSHPAHAGLRPGPSSPDHRRGRAAEDYQATALRYAHVGDRAAAFIEGDRPKSLAAEYGVILQRIYAIRKAVLDLALPAGEAEVTLRGPVEAVDAARRAFERYMERLQAA